MLTSLKRNTKVLAGELYAAIAFKEHLGNPQNRSFTDQIGKWRLLIFCQQERAIDEIPTEIMSGLVNLHL